MCILDQCTTPFCNIVRTLFVPDGWMIQYSASVSNIVGPKSLSASNAERNAFG